MSRIIVLRWEGDAPRCNEALFSYLELLPLPARYAVNDYVNVDGQPVIMSALTGGRRSWTSTKELLIESGLVLERSIASIIVELNDHSIIDSTGLAFNDHRPKRIV